MTGPTFTHVWVEAPFISNALEMLPSSVTVLHALKPPQSPTGNAGEAQAILASSLVFYGG